MANDTLSLRVSRDDHEAIERLAALEDLTLEQAILGAVHHRLAELTAPSISLLDRLESAGVVGSFDGPEDLSTNPSHRSGLGS